MLEKIKRHVGNAMPCLACPRCQKIKDDLAVKILEAPRHGEHWAARRYNSNKTQRLHDELNHVDIEPLEDLFWQMKAQLYELEPARPSAENLSTIPRFYKPKNILGDFLFIKILKKCFIFLF